MTKVNIAIFQKRFDEAIGNLQVVFVDLIEYAEQLDVRVTELEHEVALQKQQLAQQAQQIALLQKQVEQLTARLDGRQ